MATARGLLRMLAAMRAPCSVKAYGRWRILRLEASATALPGDAVTICDRIRVSLSASVNRSRKSVVGNGRRCVSRLGSRPVRSAGGGLGGKGPGLGDHTRGYGE